MIKDKQRKVFLEIKIKEYTRLIGGDYYPPISGDRDNAPENSYINNIEIYKFQNTKDIEATSLLHILFEIEDELEWNLHNLLLEEAEKTID